MTKPIPFQTTPEQQGQIFEIASEMKDAGLSRGFIDEASELAKTDQGVFDLMLMWHNENIECQRTIWALRQAINDYERPVEK